MSTSLVHLHLEDIEVFGRFCFNNYDGPYISRTNNQGIDPQSASNLTKFMAWLFLDSKPGSHWEKSFEIIRNEYFRLFCFCFNWPKYTMNVDSLITQSPFLAWPKNKEPLKHKNFPLILKKLFLGNNIRFYDQKIFNFDSPSETPHLNYHPRTLRRFSTLVSMPTTPSQIKFSIKLSLVRR